MKLRLALCAARYAGPTGVLFGRWSAREQGDVDAKDDDCRNWTSVRQRGSGRDAGVDGGRKLPDGHTNAYASSRCADCDRHTGGDCDGDCDGDSQRDANRHHDGYGDACLTRSERGERRGRRRSWLWHVPEAPNSLSRRDRWQSLRSTEALRRRRGAYF
jgi:hypothetical protein